MTDADRRLDDPELLPRIGWTLAALAVYRLGTTLPLPGGHARAFSALLAGPRGGALRWIDDFSGGGLASLSVLSLGVLPYLNALLVVRLFRGPRKPGRETRLLTLALAALQAAGLTLLLARPGRGFDALPALTLTAGALFAAWLSEWISENGLGNGVALLVLTGLAGRLPASAWRLGALVRREQMSMASALAILAALVAALASAVWLETAQRTLSVQYAKRVVGRRMMGGNSTALPLKVDQHGVSAVIFAASATAWILALWDPGPWAGGVVCAALLLLLTAALGADSHDAERLAEEMKRSGGFLPGVRAGEPTAERLRWQIRRLTPGGALLAAGIVALPGLLKGALGLPYFFDGTALLIAVGVALDTMGRVEARRMMRGYESVLRRQGRRG